MNLLEAVFGSGLVWYGPILFLAIATMFGWRHGLCDDLRRMGYGDGINRLRLGILFLSLGVVINATSWGLAEHYRATGLEHAAGALADMAYDLRPLARSAMVVGLFAMLTGLSSRRGDWIMAAVGMLAIMGLHRLWVNP